MKLLKQSYEIKATIDRVWEALTNSDVIEKWGGGPAKMSDKNDEHFTLWGGDIWGTNLVVNQKQKLVQEWYAGEWAEPSKVTFELSSKKNITVVSLIHENIPDEEYGDIKKGWEKDFMGPLKELLES